MAIHASGVLFDRVDKHVPCVYIDEVLTTIWIHGFGEITFLKLAALSEEFGTKTIEVDCDSCANRTIIIRGRTK